MLHSFKSYIFCFTLVFMLISCQNKSHKSSSDEPQTFSGMALGTDFHVTLFADDEMDIEASLDSIFVEVNRSMSTYQDNSDISKINTGDTTVVIEPMFQEVLKLSKKINTESDGYFDPTVGNLVNLYGFGPKKLDLKISNEVIDSLMKNIGVDKIKLTEDNRLSGPFPSVFLDFNGIAKGYTVDVIGWFLERKGIENYLVEIGGEIRTKGKNLKTDRAWRLGIDDPRIQTNPNELSGVLALSDKSLATSGNYRKFREDSLTGEKYVHIINPKTGLMEKSNILSASVIADDCATADAFATAFMAMGLEKAKAKAEQLKDIEVYFIYDNRGELGTYFSDGFEKRMINEPKK